MMQALYTDISIVLCSLLIVLGLYILFLSAPENTLLKNYHIARRALACAYLFFGTVNILEYVGNSSELHVPLMQLITLVVGCSQAFLFTFSLITLINPQFAERRQVIRESIPILTLSVIAFTIYFLCTERIFHVFLYVFTVFYIFLILRFSRMFLIHYRQYLTQINNFFSDNGAQHLRWVCISFFASLGMGILALLMTLIMSPLSSFLFTIVIIVFYVWFSIRFLNYTAKFRIIETAIKLLPDIKEKENSFSKNFHPIEENLKVWIAEKRFTEQGITLDLLSRQLYTNNKYLSSYFNSVENKTFRDWINDLRIMEAQNLLIQYPDMMVREIAIRTGFANQSNFGRQFLKQTGLSPNAWRKNKGSHREQTSFP